MHKRAMRLFRATAIAVLAFALAAVFAGCEGDDSRPVLSEDEIWNGDVDTYTPGQPILSADRDDGRSYGLPRAGETSIAELQQVFDDLLGNDAAFAFSNEVFTRGDTPLNDCRFDNPAISTTRLPVTVEGVVTHHPRRFFKAEICDVDEDERNWGSFVIEDDTGGLLVIRLGRTQNFTFGDRVRVTVHGIALTFSQQADTRAVITYDLEIVSGASPDQDETILYEVDEDGFTADETGTVRLVEGFVIQEPTDVNFNELIIADQPPAITSGSYRRPLTRAQDDCIAGCTNACLRAPGTCNSSVGCASFCEWICIANNETIPNDTEYPSVCWSASLDIDLGRRPYEVPRGSMIQAFGPVINNFSRQLWIYSPNQIEFLDLPN